MYNLHARENSDGEDVRYCAIAYVRRTKEVRIFRQRARFLQITIVSTSTRGIRESCSTKFSTKLRRKKIRRCECTIDNDNRYKSMIVNETFITCTSLHNYYFSKVPLNVGETVPRCPILPQSTLHLSSVLTP